MVCRHDSPGALVRPRPMIAEREKPDSKNSGSSKGRDLQKSCRELYLNYLADSREASFDRFYRATAPVFISYTRDRAGSACRGRIDPWDVVNRLYGLLVHRAERGEGLPARSLLSWCFGVLNNLVREEYRRKARFPAPLGDIEKTCRAEGPLERMLSDEERERREALVRRILHCLSNERVLLSPRDQRAMELYYRRGLPLRNVADRLKLEPSHVAVILHRARRKIRLHLVQDGLSLQR